MKLFDLICNGAVIIRQKPIGLIKAMEAIYKKRPEYKGAIFKVKYNTTFN